MNKNNITNNNYLKIEKRRQKKAINKLKKQIKQAQEQKSRRWKKDERKGFVQKLRA